MMLFTRTNPRRKRGRTKSTSAKPTKPSQPTSLTLSLPPNRKRHSDDASCSSYSISSRTASTATASTVTTTGNGNSNSLALDIGNANPRRNSLKSGNLKDADSNRSSNTNGNRGHVRSNSNPAPKLDLYLARNNPSPSPSDESSHDSTISSWQRHPPLNRSSVTSSVQPGDPIAHLENEVAKLSALLNRHRKYTPEWFVLDTKLSAAREELDAVREDRDLDFLLPDPPTTDSVGGGGGKLGIPETVLVRSDEVEERGRNLPRLTVDVGERGYNNIPTGTSVGGEKMSQTQKEYQEATRKLAQVDKFSDEWFLLQEQVIELRSRVMEEAVNNTICPESPREIESTAALPSLSPSSNMNLRDEEDVPYLMPIPLQRGYSDQSRDLYPYERPSEPLFIPQRSISPPLRYSPPSSPLVSRNLFPSSASINSAYYNENLSHIRTEHDICSQQLEMLPRFSKEWFELKTKTVHLEEQMDLEGSDSWSHFSYGVGDRSVPWSEEEEDVMSFASDLELCMVGEALKQGNCFGGEFEEYQDEFGQEGEFADFDVMEKEGVMATLIQAKWRGCDKNKAYRSLLASVVRVQAFVRCKQQRARYQQQRRSLIALQSSMRQHQAATKYQQSVFSVTRIQSVFRRAKAVRARQEASRSRTAVASIQSPVRRWLARSSYVHKRSNAVLIQSLWRGKCERKAFLQMRAAMIILQAHVRRKQQTSFRQISLNVLLIQRVFRGCLARGRLHKEQYSVSRSILQDQDSIHSRSISEHRESSSQANSKCSASRPSVEVIQSHHRALSLRRSQVPKFSDEWFYTTELLQGLEHELRIREREQTQGVNDELLSLQDSCYDDEQLLSLNDSRYSDEQSGRGSFPKILPQTPPRHSSTPPTGRVMRMVQTIERQTSLLSSPELSIGNSTSWTQFSANEFAPSFPSNEFAAPPSPRSTNSEEENLQRLGKECLRLTQELEHLPRFSDAWFQCKVELKAITEEIEFVYSQMSKR